MAEIDLKKENITCCVQYTAQSDPTCKTLVNGEVVSNFVADNTQHQFEFTVTEGRFSLRLEHFGKDMKRETEKFVEFKKILLNGIDVKQKIWETTQVAEVPEWQNKDDFEWESNLYLGHNAYVEYIFESPILDFLHAYHTKGAKVSSNMESYDLDLLSEMKEYFTEIVRRQDAEK